MKIICNKAEFAKIVRNCYKANDACGSCLLYGICDGSDSIVALTDVEEERGTPERGTCITCKWWRADKSVEVIGNHAVCGNHRGLAKITENTSCCYWEPVKMIKAGDTDEKPD